MSTRNFITYLALFLWLAQVVHSQHSYQNASLLEAALLTNYYTNVRPTDSVTVSVDLGLYHITTLDIVEQRLSLIGFLLTKWNDPRLTWTNSSYGYMDETFLTNSKIWVPPLTLANPADGIKFISDDSDAASLPIKVTSDGDVIWIAQGNFEIYCTVDITFYPFDSQECNLLITSWMYEATELDLTNADETANTDLFETHGEWELAKSEVETGIRTLHDHPTSMLKFTLYLNRKYSYYILSMILPNTLLAFLSCLVFYLPTETDRVDKTDMAMTILLSLAVLITGVSTNIPTTSQHICILNVYLLCTLAVTSLQIWVVQVLQQWNINYENGCQLTPILRKVAMVLGKIVFYRPSRTDDESMVISTPVDNAAVRNTNSRHDRRAILADIEGELAGNGHHKLPNTDSPVAWDKGDSGADGHEEEAYTYRDLTRISDKVAFYFFLGATSLMTIVFMAVLSSGDDRY